MKQEHKEILVSKWLEGTLSDSERSQFEQLPEYEEYTKISEYATYFKAPDYNSEEAFSALKPRLKNSTQRPRLWISIAAVITALLALGTFLLLQVHTPNEAIEVATMSGETKTVILPDNSEVVLNAGSKLLYNEDVWETDRKVALDGEAFFMVEKGSTFEVHTDQGKITVLGTQFNVKDRLSIFEVQTFEGLVLVESDSKSVEIGPGKGIQKVNDIFTQIDGHSELFNPTWIEKISTFESTPYSEVLDELERQYNVKVRAENINKNIQFTGSFTHTDMHRALQSITLPMRLSYVIEGSTIVLKRS